MMTGYGGTSKSGRSYFYYSCKNARKRLCNKKIVDKQTIEDKVVAECWNLLTDETIAKTAQAVFNACQRDYDSSTLKSLRRDLKAAEAAIENLWKALEQGQELDGLRERIEKRTADKKEIEAQIAVEENRETFFTIEQITFFLNKLKDGSLSDEAGRRGLINIFVNAIYLFDDRMTLVLNGGNVKTEINDILLDEIEADNESAKCSHIGATGSPATFKGEP